MTRRRCAAALAIAAACACGGASAEPVGLLRVGNGGEAGVRWECANGRSAGRPGVSETNVRAWTAASLEGRLASRRWLTYAWVARPSVVRSDGKLNLASSTTEEFAHDLTLVSRPAPWIGAQATASRDRIVADRGPDAARESRFRREEARGDLRLPFASLGAIGRRERSDERWTSSALAPELERHVERSSAETFLESSRMRLSHRNARERVPENATDVETRQTSFDHTLPWGHGSQLRTRLEWADQSGNRLTFVDRSAQENLRVRHAPWLTSDYAAPAHAQPARRGRGHRSLARLRDRGAHGGLGARSRRELA